MLRQRLAVGIDNDNADRRRRLHHISNPTKRFIALSPLIAGTVIAAEIRRASSGSSALYRCQGHSFAS